MRKAIHPPSNGSRSEALEDEFPHFGRLPRVGRGQGLFCVPFLWAPCPQEFVDFTGASWMQWQSPMLKPLSTCQPAQFGAHEPRNMRHSTALDEKQWQSLRHGRRKPHCAARPLPPSRLCHRQRCSPSLRTGKSQCTSGNFSWVEGC